MIICYICEHKISPDYKYENNSEPNDKINCEKLECSCTCHIKSTVIFN